MPYTQITLTQLLTRLKARYESVPYWTDDEAMLYLNEGLQFYGMLTGRWKRRVTVNTTANTAEVSLPAAMTYRMRLAFDGYPLSPTSLSDLNNGTPRWRTDTTVTVGCPSRPTLWAPISLNILVIWPQDAAGHNALIVDGVSDTPILVDPGDFVDLSEADVNVLLGYALHAAALKRGGPWFKDSLPYFQAFLRHAGEENELITTSQAYRRAAGLDDDPLKPLKQGQSSVSRLAAQGS